MLVLAALLLLQQQVPDTALAIDSIRGDSARVESRRRDRRPPRRIPLTPELERTAFADSAARGILHRARRARLTQDSLLQSYEAKTYHRFSAGMALRALARERLALRHESSARVQWVRGRGPRVEVTGARGVAPIAGQGGMEHSDGGYVPIPYFPGRESLFPMSAFSTVRAEVDENELVHPLATGAEAYYRYETGGMMSITLPNRERIPLRELRVTARRPQWKLFVGSFWFDDRTGQLVRAAYRLSEPMDIWEIAAEEGAVDLAAIDADTALRRRDPAEWERRRQKQIEEEVPAAVRTFINPMQADISAITTEYELREGRFWLPRANYAEGMVRAGFVRSPVTVEERYEYLSVNAIDSLPTMPAYTSTDELELGDSVARADSLDVDVVDEVEVNVSIAIGGGGEVDSAVVARRRAAAEVRQREAEAKDTTGRLRRRRLRREQRERECATVGSYTVMRSQFEGALRYPVTVPCNRDALVTSADLPASIYDDGDELFDKASRDELVNLLDFGLQSRATGAPVEPYWNVGLLRYNRVEGLSSAVGARWEPGGGWNADGRLRLGLADLRPNAELTVARSNIRRTLALSGYHRLAAANDRGDPLSFGSSLGHLLFGRDEGFYYRATGAELSWTGQRFAQLRWRVFAEDHRTARKETDYSLAKTVAGTGFIDNIDADEGFFTGVGTNLGFARGLDPRGFRLSGDWRVEGAIGPADYARTALDATLARGLGARSEAALTAAAGWSGGELPAQRLWYLGGAQTVRGQTANTQRGDAFWLGRLELARSWPVMRPVVFGDVGWAGDRARMFDQPGGVMTGAGVGASFLQGLMRVDLSRGIRPTQQWRVDLYLDARF